MKLMFFRRFHAGKYFWFVPKPSREKMFCPRPCLEAPCPCKAAGTCTTAERPKLSFRKTPDNAWTQVLSSQGLLQSAGQRLASPVQNKLAGVWFMNSGKGWIRKRCPLKFQKASKNIVISPQPSASASTPAPHSASGAKETCPRSLQELAIATLPCHNNRPA